MKGIAKIGRILGIAVFISSIVLYLLFAATHPLFHNHPIDNKYHHNCPACNFLIIASFSNVPEVIIVFSIFLQKIYWVFINYQRFYTQSFYKNCFPRSPPMLFG